MEFTFTGSSNWWHVVIPLWLFLSYSELIIMWSNGSICISPKMSTLNLDLHHRINKLHNQPLAKSRCWFSDHPGICQSTRQNHWKGSFYKLVRSFYMLHIPNKPFSYLFTSVPLSFSYNLDTFCTAVVFLKECIFGGSWHCFKTYVNPVKPTL